ncbi:TRL-like family protein [Leptospira fainei serovar Hurstbridge str. BUT 6]|uniref:TRL-like family protein n=1 Tax=Leptospira fainei serovar Hurstbridge str. BUT 6 TaxID=1193011 RepID=S3VDS8_9LEPT|nr:TRL-like family protein [Leptospira fainei]EPG74645.1 TRL-like family protein [Leptospira fainei serovar Hurstbridge str. BUT 6]
MSYGYGVALNTNPTKEYANPNYIPIKGGLIVHSGTIPGPIGHNAESLANGSACSRSILGLVAFGDSSIEAAKANGKIVKVANVDFEQFGVIAGWIYHSFCTVVSGSTNSSAAPESKAEARTIPGKKK